MTTKAPNHKVKRLRGLQAQGIKYQRDAQRYLKRRLSQLCQGRASFKCNKWLIFSDENFDGYAQPDCWLETRDFIFCFEIKRSATTLAWGQLERLYKPLLKMLFKKPVVCIQMCQYLKLRHPTSSLEEILASPSEERFLIHWNPKIDRD